VGPFAGWVACELGKKNDVHVYVSGLVIDFDGKVKPFCSAVPLNQEGIPLAATSCDSVGIKIVVPVHVSSPSTSNLAQHFFSIEKSEHQWNNLCGSFAAVSWWKLFLWLDSCVMLILMMRTLRYYRRWRRIPAPRWVRRDQKLVEAFVGMVMLNIGAVGCWLLPSYCAWALSATLCSIAFIFVLLVPGSEETLWGRSKNTSGITCGILVMPLILKALLLYYGLN
jgi:hypothetical protein